MVNLYHIFLFSWYPSDPRSNRLSNDDSKHPPPFYKFLFTHSWGLFLSDNLLGSLEAEKEEGLDIGVIKWKGMEFPIGCYSNHSKEKASKTSFL